MRERVDRRYQRSDYDIRYFGNVVMGKEARRIDIDKVEIYRGAKVSRATFSRHYRGVTDIKVREEERVLRRFRQQLRSSDNREAVIFKFVLLVYKNREIFRVCIKRNDVFLLRRVIFLMNRLVMRGWRKYGGELDKKMGKWCTHLVMAVIEDWGRRNFRGDMLEEKAVIVGRVYDFLEKHQSELVRIDLVDKKTSSKKR